MIKNQFLELNPMPLVEYNMRKIEFNFQDLISKIKTLIRFKRIFLKFYI